MLWRSFGSQWSTKSTVLNSNIFLLSNVYNSIIIAVDYFCCILAVGCKYLRAFDAISILMNKN